jgi:tetratricopeptide (TPR) repeat protein
VHGVRDNEPGAGEAMKIAATALIRMGAFPVARLALERAHKLQPDQYEVAVMLAELNLDLGNGQRGIELLETAVQLRPGDFRPWLTMAKACHDLGESDKAIQAYQEVLRQRPAHRAALIELIETFVRSGQSDRAGPWVNKAIGQYPGDPVVLGLAAHSAFDANRLDESIALASRALERDPQNAHALMARARARVARAQWQGALPDAERAAAVADDVSALQLLWLIEKRLGMSQRAAATVARRSRVQQRTDLMTELTGKIAQDPDNPQHPWRMGVLAMESGQALLARRCFEAALALDPNHQAARESLAALRGSHPAVFGKPDQQPVLEDVAGNSAVGRRGRREGH